MSGREPGTAGAVLVGAVQGLTEFLPVSSSAHLALVRRLARIPQVPRSLDVLLHLATTAALIPTTHRAVTATGVALARDVCRHRTDIGRYGAEGRHALNLVLATAPSILAGGLLHRQLERWSRRREAPVLGLLAGSALLALGQWRDGWISSQADAKQLSPGTALLIGTAQAAALYPGVSRSGATIAAALLLGFDRAGAVDLSFQLAVPVTLAATVRTLPELMRGHLATPLLPEALAVASAFASSVAGVIVLRRLVASAGLAPFVAYRCALAGAIWVLASRNARPTSSCVVHSLEASTKGSNVVP